VVRVGNLKSGSVGSVGSALLLPAVRDLHSRPPKTYLLKLGRNYPECLENLRVLDEHEEAAHGAATRGDRDAYLEALRGYCRAGRDEALRIRRGAA